jgi:hypothetical protein
MTPSRSVAVGDRVGVTLEFLGGRKLAAQFDVRGPSVFSGPSRNASSMRISSWVMSSERQ